MLIDHNVRVFDKSAYVNGGRNIPAALQIHGATQLCPKSPNGALLCATSVFSVSALKIKRPREHTKPPSAFAEEKWIHCQRINHRSFEADWRSIVERNGN
jgi:hypothetical protein